LKKTTASLLIVMVLLVFASSSSNVISSSSTPSIKLLHVIEVKNGGLLIVNDTVMIDNNGDKPLDNFRIGFPEYLRQALDSVSAYSYSGEALSVVENVSLGGQGIYGFQVNLTKPVDVGEKYNFTITFVFSRLVWMESSIGAYVALFPEYPSIPYEATECNATVILPTGVTLYNSIWEYDGTAVTSISARQLPPYWNVTGYVSFSDSLLLISCDWAKRVIVLDSSAQIIFEDTYHLSNVGYVSLTSMTFFLPKDAKDIEGYDAFFGEIKVTSNIVANQIVATVDRSVDPRFPGVDPGGNCTFTLRYVVPAESPYLTREGMWDYRLETKFFENLQYTIRELTVEIVPPEGAVFLSYPRVRTQYPALNGNLNKEGYQESLTYKLYNVTMFQDLNLAIEYRYIIFWSAYRPTLWLSIAIAAICSVLVIRRRSRPPTHRLPEKNLQVLKAFVEICSERAALRSEYNSSEENFDVGKMRKKEYKRRQGILQQQLRDLDRQFVLLKRDVQSIEPRFREVVRQIEVAETEIESSRLNISKLKTQYRSGSLSKEAYEKLRDDYERRSDRAQTAVDDAILRLRGEIR